MVPLSLVGMAWFGLWRVWLLYPCLFTCAACFPVGCHRVLSAVLWRASVAGWGGGMLIVCLRSGVGYRLDWRSATVSIWDAAVLFSHWDLAPALRGLSSTACPAWLPGCLACGGCGRWCPCRLIFGLVLGLWRAGCCTPASLGLAVAGEVVCAPAALLGHRGCGVGYPRSCYDG